MSELKQALQHAIKTLSPSEELYSVLGTVIDVDIEKRLCDVSPLDGSAELYDCRLQSGITEKGWVLIPKKGSTVVVTFLNKHLGYIALCDELDEIIIDSPKVTLTITESTLDGDKTTINIKDLKINADQITFNGGDLGGMVKLAELQDNLNSLKTFVEAMHSALPSAFSAIGAGTAAAGSAGGSTYTTSMTGQSIALKDMENTKIKQ